MSREGGVLDQNMIFLGILIGLVLGGIIAITRVSKSGELRRKDLEQFGGASLELEIEASMREAKSEARQRLNEDE